MQGKCDFMFFRQFMSLSFAELPEFPAACFVRQADTYGDFLSEIRYFHYRLC